MPPELEGSGGGFPSPPRRHHLAEEDVCCIWTSVSDFIIHQMDKQKGVHIAPLGTFTLSRQKMDVGNNKFVLLQRPVFIVSEKFAQMHALKYSKIHVTGDIPVIPLNFMSVALESSFPRDIVEECIKETLQLFFQSIGIQQTVEFVFTGIGQLIVKQGNVKMKFYKEFLQSMDHSGNLTKALANRPETCDSVMSSRKSSDLRPRTTSAILFPRIECKGAESEAALETILEECDDVDVGEPVPECSEPSDKEVVSKIGARNTSQECSSGKRLLSRQMMAPVKVPEVTVMEEPDTLCKPRTAPVKLVSTFHPKTVKKDEECPMTSTFPKMVPTASCPDHCRAGQELCYLCMQRAQRNIPVYLHEERRREDEREDLILHRYQCMKDREALQQAQMKSMANKEQKKEIACYNFDASEAVKNQKAEKPTECPNSYIFLKRRLTPPAFLKQQKYLLCLNEDVEHRKNKEFKLKQDKERLDQLEQVQLSAEIADLKEKRLKLKNERMLTYKGSLDTQVMLKGCGKPAPEPFVPETIYGMKDLSNEKQVERRRKAGELFKEQVKASCDRKRTVVINALMKHMEEADMLKKLKEETVAERSARFNKMVKLQKAMEEDWGNSVELKRQRECEEEKYIHSGSKLLLEQSEKYRRCYQCKRRLNNIGETNIWCESRYIPGSRILL